MAISPYGGHEVSLGRVRILLDVEIDLTDRDVLLVEDIVDTGLTLSYLLSILRSRNPASLEVCTLLDRSIRRIVLSPPIRGVRLPGPLRGRVRPRLRAAISEPRRHPEISDTAALKADLDALLPSRRPGLRGGCAGRRPSYSANT